jgi:hypothetical protein
MTRQKIRNIESAVNRGDISTDKAIAMLESGYDNASDAMSELICDAVLRLTY